MSRDITKTKLYKRAFSSITVIVLLSLLFAAFSVSVANDLYAFVRADARMELSLDSPMEISHIAKRLQDGGIIHNPLTFSIYARLKGVEDDIEAFRGSINLTSDMSYREIVEEFLK